MKVIKKIIGLILTPLALTGGIFVLLWIVLFEKGLEEEYCKEEKGE